MANELESERVSGDPDAEGTGCGLEARVGSVNRFGDDGYGTREKVGVEVVGELVEVHILFCHGSVCRGDCYLANPVTLVGEKPGDGGRTLGVGGEAIASFGGENDQFSPAQCCAGKFD